MALEGLRLTKSFRGNLTVLIFIIKVQQQWDLGMSIKLRADL
jgi:hypothetical protein